MAKPVSKVTPEVLMIAYLDELSGKLSDLITAVEWSEREGMLTPITVAATPALAWFTCSPPWQSFTAINDGPNPVYLDVNREDNAVNLRTPLNNGETVVVDFHQPKITRIYHMCLPAQAASVRIFGTW